MAWSTTVVSPPDGDMAALFASLCRLGAREEARFLPGHGPAVADPPAWCRALLERCPPSMKVMKLIMY
jgi:glyoxylase-like metal-dependent hydrolase (beta-lactamase superfamily II)